MIDRIMQFLPSILVIASIAISTFIYLKVVIKKIGPAWKSVEWHSKNKWKVIWLVGAPAVNVWAPTAEELIFRAPIIIAFGTMSSSAWIGILISSAVFGAIHWFGKKINILEILSEKEAGNIKTDNLDTELSELEATQSKRVRIQRIAHVFTTMPLGVLSGYYGIKYQSIWVSVSIHAIWNLVMPIILPLFVLIVVLSVLGISTLWIKLRWSRS